jgi:GlpG protein
MNLEDSVGLIIFVLVIAAFVYLSNRSAKKKRATFAADRQQSAPSVTGRFPPITLALIALSVAVGLWSNFGKSVTSLLPLFIADPGSQGFQSVFAGEFWRLLTPIFIHFGFLHILFNMMWLWDLGGMIEKIKGWPFFVGFVLAVGIASNVAQYLIDGSPFFGGMSGVVYGLLGYVWISGRRHPQNGFGLHQQTAVMMFGWYVLCWTGLLGPVANWAHTAGLVIGIAIGYPRPAQEKAN